MPIINHPLFSTLCPRGLGSLSRHDTTQIRIKDRIATLLAETFGKQGPPRRLLEVGGDWGVQTRMYVDELPAGSEGVLCDWTDRRHASVRDTLPFVQVDLERQGLPFEDRSFDAVVCNQVLEHLKNIFGPLSEIARVLRPGGVLIVSVPNLSAPHNVLLSALGRQPSTLRIWGSHVRGYAIHSMTQFLESTGHLKVERMDGLGLHPFTSAMLPGPLKTYCHTPVWLCRRTEHEGPRWDDQRAGQVTTTNFFASESE